MKLDLDERRTPAAPQLAATVVVARDHVGDVEVFCVERSKASRFLGGAVVFPGGKVDDADWAKGASEGHALRVAACRELLEEAAILLTTSRDVDTSEVENLRAKLAAGQPLSTVLVSSGLDLATEALVPLARWITPTSEPRRYDTYFFIARAPARQTGAHDSHETSASFWATPSHVLQRFDRGEIALAPPTHRTLAVLASARSVEEALAIARASSLEPVCPEVVRERVGHGNEVLALVLPGDPAHSVSEARVPGPSRFVLREGRFVPEAPTR